MEAAVQEMFAQAQARYGDALKGAWLMTGTGLRWIYDEIS